MLYHNHYDMRPVNETDYHDACLFSSYEKKQDEYEKWKIVHQVYRVLC